MSMSKITLIGFQDYMNANNDDLFSKMTLPEGISKDVLVENIMLKGGEFEVLFANPYYMQNAISTWCHKWQWSFERWVRLISEEYNPLHNYDRTEIYTDETRGNVKNTSTATTESTSSDSSSGTGSSTSEDTKSAFDSTDYEPLNKNTSGNTNSSTSNTSSDIDSSSESENVENRTFTHTAKMYGNIGVMSSQQMFQQESEVAMFNLYDKITDIFLQEFVLPVY